MQRGPEGLARALADRYLIEREVGAGGMATVYLAHDVRHDRKVAIKVLRPELSAIVGAGRFLAEIKTTAHLQHPHILSLFDSGEADGQVYYVMPFVEGESLRDRLEREKQLPVDDALRIAREVADALQYAHQHGVVHRDIKPENVLLHGGHALVADFGIALAASRTEGGSRMTETGMSLGTPHYMSPEQAMGAREITARSDVYALGVMLYEMLTGDPPFTGSTPQAIVARVLTEAPRSITSQRHTVPAGVEDAIFTALEKLPADRFATAAEFAQALGRSGTDGTGRTGGAPARGGTVSLAVGRRRRWTTWGLTATTVLATGLAAWGWSRNSGSNSTIREYITFGDGHAVSAQLGFSLALSPDGSVLAFKDSGQNGRLWTKRRDQLDATPLAGTERATNPVFSPDGEWILFTADQQLKKVKITTGSVVPLADSTASGFGGGTWLDDGTIIYVDTRLSTLMRIGAGGGTPSVAFDNRELQGNGFGFPSPLPDARGVLFVSCSSGCATMSLRVLDLRTGKQHLLLGEVGQSWYLPNGQLLYTRRDGTSLLAPFDLKTLQITGAGIPVLTGVFVSNGYTQLAWSNTGSLVYAAGTGANNEATILRVSRAGAETPIDPALHGALLSLSPSPDGKKLAVGVGGGTGVLNIWVKELDHGPFTRLSFGGADRRPAWSPDGKMVAFIRDTFATSLVVGRYADGSRPDTVLMRLARQIQGVDWSPDGKWLVARTDNSVAGAGDLVGVRTSGDTTPVELVASPFTELHPAVSPDGHWLAYTSNESGQNEVYVRPFPNTNDGRWQVSTAGGIEPRWSRDGTELFFLAPPGNLYAARIVTRPSFAVTGIQTLFDVNNYVIDAFHTSYAVTADGRSFLFSAPLQGNGPIRTAKVIRIDGWFSDLRRTLAE